MTYPATTGGTRRLLAAVFFFFGGPADDPAAATRLPFFCSRGAKDATGTASTTWSSSSAGVGNKNYEVIWVKVMYLHYIAIFIVGPIPDRASDSRLTRSRFAIGGSVRNWEVVFVIQIFSSGFGGDDVLPPLAGGISGIFRDLPIECLH